MANCPEYPFFSEHHIIHHNSIICIYIYTRQLFICIHLKIVYMYIFVYTRKLYICIYLYTPENCMYVYICIHQKIVTCPSLKATYPSYKMLQVKLPTTIFNRESLSKLPVGSGPKVPRVGSSLTPWALSAMGWRNVRQGDRYSGVTRVIYAIIFGY